LGPGLRPEELRLLAALEEMRSARKALDGLAGAPGVDISIHAERLVRRIEDVDAIGTPPHPDRLRLLTAPAEPEAALLEGFIRPGTTVMLTGPPGTSKSWAARQLAMAACTARPFLERYIVPHPLRVLTIDEDNGAAEEWRREELVLAESGLSRADLGDAQRISLAGVRLDEERWQRWLRGQIEAERLELLILDPISEMHGGKELREDPSFRAMLAFLKRLKVDFPGLGTLLVHHTRKTGREDRSTERGLDDDRGQWGQTPDVVALLTNLGERRARWEVHKRMPHSRLILEAPEYGPVRVVADETSVPVRVSTDNRVLSAIEAGADTAEDIETGTGIPRRTVFSALKRLRSAGLVAKATPLRLAGEER
jgi:DNA-binding transcriptional ArsR family regulator